MCVGGIHLVRLAIAEARRGSRRLAKGSVQARSLLGRVGEDRGVDQTRAVEPGTQRRDLAVHHRAGPYEVGAGLGVHDGGGRQSRQRAVVVDFLSIENSAVAVRRVLAQAHVSHQREGQSFTTQPAQRLRHRAAWIVGARSLRIFGFGDAEQQDTADAEVGQARRLAQREVGRQPEVPLQRRDLMAVVVSVDHEQRSDQLRWVDTGFSDERAQRGVCSQAPGSLGPGRDDRCFGNQLTHLCSPRLESLAPPHPPAARRWARRLRQPP